VKAPWIQLSDPNLLKLNPFEKAAVGGMLYQEAAAPVSCQCASTENARDKAVVAVMVC
jgi:hypothetical protein